MVHTKSNSENHSTRHIGEFAHDAPGLANSLVRALGEDSKQVFQAAYSMACAAGGLNESPVVRPQDASFNPRPARICSIALKEAKELRMTPLLSAILLGAKDPLTIEQPRDAHMELQQAVELQKQLLECLIDFQRLRDIEPEYRNLVASSHLDRLRHLHMTDLPAREQAFIVGKSMETLLPELGDSKNSRLLIMLETILKRLQQRLR